MCTAGVQAIEASPVVSQDELEGMWIKSGGASTLTETSDWDAHLMVL